MKLAQLVSVAAVLVGLAPLKPLSAQSTSVAEPGDIVRVDGAVTLDGHDFDASVAPTFMKDNSVLRTADGRAEVLLSKGVALRLGQQSSFRMIRRRLGDVRVEMLGGTAFVIAAAVPKEHSVTIACEDAITPSDAGVYRFDAYPAWAAGDGHCRLKVYKGSADVRLATLNVLVKSGQTRNMQSECGDHIPTFPFKIDDADALNESTGAFRSGWVPENRANR